MSHGALVENQQFTFRNMLGLISAHLLICLFLGGSEAGGLLPTTQGQQLQ